LSLRKMVFDGSVRDIWWPCAASFASYTLLLHRKNNCL
jgi:hypothetical protein